MPTSKIIGGIGFIALIAFGVWAALPLFRDKQINEAAPYVSFVPATETAGGDSAGPSPSVAPGTALVHGTGTFTGFDTLHNASGTARVVTVDGKTYVRFEDDFMVTNGPDLYVYFGNNGEYDSNTNLGRLKGNQGGQNYEVPAGINAAQYTEVWVWCRAFEVPFGKAVLQ